MNRKSIAAEASDLAELIHAKIVSGELTAGSRLRQEQLAKEFSVSRTPVREALRQLEVKGIISREPNHSAVVRAPSPREIREIYQVRAQLEGFAAELAARWMTDAQFLQLAEVHSRFETAVRGLGARRSENAIRIKGDSRMLMKLSRNWAATNAEFHAIIHQSSNNQSLARIISDLNLGHIRNVMMSSSMGMDLSRMQQNISDHKEIMDALEHHDPLAAREAMTDHILRSAEIVTTWFENQSAARPM